MRNSPARRSFIASAALAACLLSAAGLAQPSAQDRETARTLLLDGRKKMAARQYEEALKMFRAAHAIMNVPTTGLDLARAQEALGQLVEARETALAVAKLPVEPGESKVFAKARTDAAELASALVPRIPSLTLTLNGAPADASPAVTIDGAAVPAAALGLPRKLNPGKHTVEVTLAGFLTEKRGIDLREGDTRTETVALKPDAQAAPPPATTAAPTAAPTATATASAAPAAPPPPPPTAVPEPPRPAERRIPVWAWVSGGLGLAATGVSVGFLIDHLDARQTVQNECPEGLCDRTRHDLDSMTALRARWNRDLALTLGFGAAGLAGLSAAVVGIVSAPRTAGVGLTVVPWAAPSQGGGLSVTGAF